MKGENNLKTMVYLAIVITVVIGSTLSIIDNLSRANGLSPDLQTLNHSIVIDDELEEAYNLFKNEENIQSNWLGDQIVTGGKIIWSFITLMIETPGMIIDLIKDLGSIIGIPPIFLLGVGAFLLAVGLFALLDILSSK